MIVLLFFLLGCSGSKDSPLKEDTDETEEGLVLPTSGCGLPAYDFLPTTGMGEIVSIDHRPELSMSKEAISSLVDNFSFPLPPPQYDVETYYIQYRTQDKGEEVLATGIISISNRTADNIPITTSRGLGGSGFARDSCEFCTRGGAPSSRRKARKSSDMANCLQ